MTAPWLTLIGIGENGRDGLSSLALRLIEEALFVIGGERHLALIGKIKAETKIWPKPFEQGIEAILARRGKPTVVLASGDPFFFGVGATLSKHIPPEEMLTLPAPSAFSLTAAKLGWPMQDCTLLSLHGRPFERIAPHLQPNAKLIALTWDGETPLKLAGHLVEHGMGESLITVCEALGGPRERTLKKTAQAILETREIFDPLNTLGIEIIASRGARIIPLASGLEDDLFEHDNQITKREIRAITLSSLAPRQGEVLWDIGAGSGSVSIEWMLRHPSNRAIAIEPRADRAARIARNALAFGVPELRIVEGSAPDALANLAPPDAIFIGGGGTDPAVIDTAWDRLPEGGRLVANAVTLETQADLMRRYTMLGGTLGKIEVSRADPVGPFHGWRASMPVIQWVIVKGEEKRP
jgi:precorrin-6B C5,15-methyltransferase / cobalt-precorrin-6B C5,C15-methyltransferase